MLIKAIAYNLMLWFKEATMPEEVKNCRAKTIRRKVLCLPDNIVGNGRYRHIRLAATESRGYFHDSLVGLNPKLFITYFK